jgi:hypothetical protein
MPAVVSDKQPHQLYKDFWAQQYFAQHFVHMYMLLIAPKQTQFPSVTASLLQRLRLGNGEIYIYAGFTL